MISLLYLISHILERYLGWVLWYCYCFSLFISTHFTTTVMVTKQLTRLGFFTSPRLQLILHAVSTTNTTLFLWFNNK